MNTSSSISRPSSGPDAVTCAASLLARTFMQSRNLCLAVAIALLSISSLSKAANQTYTMQTSDLSAFQTYDQNSNSPGKGDFNSGSTALGFYAHDGGNGIVQSVGFETFNTSGNGSAGLTARSLQVGDSFSITIQDNTTPWGLGGIFFNQGTLNGSAANYNANNAVGVALTSSGLWQYTTNGGTSWTTITGNFGPGTIALKLDITSDKSFNLSANGTLIASDLSMSSAGLIQSMAMINQNDKNGGSNTDLIFSAASLTNTGTVTVGGGSLNTTATISGVIANGLVATSNSTSSTNSLTKNGTGTITLSGNNTYSGGTTISAGTLAVANNNALGTSATSTVSMANGTTLANLDSSAHNLNNNNTITFTGGSANFVASSNLTLSGGSNPLNTVSGAAVNLSVTGGGTLFLLNSAPNLGSAATPAVWTVSASELSVLAGNNLGALPSSGTNPQVILQNAGILSGAGSFSAGRTLRIDSSGGTLRDVLNTPLGAIYFSPSIVDNADSSHTFTINNADGTNALVTTIAGTISGTGGVTKTGAGTVAFNSANGYGGSTMIGNTATHTSGGTLRLGIANALPTATSLVFDDGGANTSILNLNGFNQTVASLSDGSNSSGNITNSGGAATFTLNNTNSGFFYGTMTGTNLAFFKTGSGTEEIGGANTFGGGATVKAGTVIVGVSNVGTTSGAFGPSTAGAKLGDSSGTSAASILIGRAGGSGPGATGGLAFSNNITLQDGTSGTLTLGVQNTSGTNTFSGNITLGSTTNTAQNVTLTAAAGGEVDFTGNILANGSSIGNVTVGGGSKTGLVKVTGTNTYSGTTTVSTGTLMVGNGSTTGTLGTGAVTDSARIIFNRSNGYSVSNLISGNGSVAVIGGGTITYNSTESYTGDTYVMNNSTLALGASVFNSSTIRLGGDFGNTGLQNQTQGGTLEFTSLTGSQTFSGIINTVTGNTSNALLLKSDNTSGTNTLSANNYLDSALSTTVASGGTLLFQGGSVDFKGQTLTVGGAGNTTLNENLTSSTSSAGVAGGSLVKSGSGTLILQNTSNTYTGTSSGSLNASGTQINAGTLGIYGDGSLGVAPSGAYANIQFTGNATLQDTANDISLNANRNITIATGATATFDTNGHALTINGIVSSPGAASVVKTGSGTLTVNSASGGLANNSTWTVQGGSYNSATGLYDSVLAIAGGNVLGGSTGNVLNLGAGTLQFTANGGAGYLSTRTINVTASGGAISDGGFAPGDATAGGSTIAPAITIASGSGLNLVSTNKLQLYSVISGNGTLTKFGNGTATLLGANTYIGTTTISGGTLQIGNGTTAGSLSSSSTIIDNGTLVFDRSNTVTAGTDFSGSAISGSGSIVQSGSGKLLLWSGNTFTGGVTINSGTLGIWEGSGLGPIPGTPTTNLTFGGNSTLQFQQTPTQLPLNANRLIAINSGVTATIDTQSYSPSIAGVISGATGGLVKIGSGTLTLNGADTYGGGTSVSAGTLQLGSATALGLTTGSLALSAATLNLGGFSATAGALTSSGGTFSGFTLGTNFLTVSSASVSGTNYIGITNAVTASVGTYNLINSSGGGLTGTFQFSGAQDLTVPVNSIIAKTSTGYVRLTLSNTSTAEQIVVSNSIPANTINIMPLGASITFGSSATGTAKNGDVITSYNGGGYHAQLYQDLVNDGRFNPNFVGSNAGTGAVTSNTGLGAVNPNGTNVLTTAGQTASEGHPGYRTSQILYNLNHNDGDSTANGGFWLASGNGRNPDYVPLNVGGNDFLGGLNQNTSAVSRYDAIISELNTLRPGVAAIVGSLAYRTDVGAAQNTYFNPYVPGIVYNHVLAGQDVRFLDFYTLLSPGNSTNILSSDGIHPTQAGYNMMANAWSESTIYGAAYWKGGQGGNWSTVNGTDTNWAMNRAGTIDRQKSLADSTTRTYTGAYADVYFNSNSSALATTVDADTTVRSLNFTSGATGAVSIGGSNTLTIGAGGITVQQGTGPHDVSSNVALGANQTWGNVSGNNFTVSGVISGSGNLTIAGGYSVQTAGTFSSNANTALEIVATNTSTVTGTGAIVLSGNNTYTGTTTVNSGTLILNGTNSTSGVSVASGAIIGGSGKIAGAISGAGLVSPGNSPGILAANQVNPSGGLGFAFEFTATGGPVYGNAAASVNDVLHLNNATTPFAADLNGSNTVSIYLSLTTLSAGNTFQGGFFTDKNVDFLSNINSAAFAYYVKGNGGGSHAFNGFNYYTLAEYSAGFSINLSTVQVASAAFADGTVTNGYISQLNVVPEPTPWALLASSLTMFMIFRRRNRH